MTIKKILMHTLLLFFGLSSLLLQPVSSATSIFGDIGDLLSTKKAVAATNEDWLENGKTSARTRMVDDSKLNPLIMYKAKLNLGWSVSQVIAVGKYFYVLAAIPPESEGDSNFFHLPSGTYLYRIPTDFKFKGNLSNAQLRTDLISKGASAVLITSYKQTYSHPTYNPANKTFYVGVDTKVYAVKEDPFERLSHSINTGARLTSAPMVVGNDLIVVGTSTDDTNGGRIYTVKGLGTASSTISSTYYELSNLANAEIASPAAISATTFAIGLNYRNSGRTGHVMKLTANDNGFGKQPKLKKNWNIDTVTGVAANPMFYSGYIYAPSKYGTVYKINASSGKVTWKSDVPGGATLINNTPATDGTYIYQPVRRPGKVSKIRMSDGKAMWTLPQGYQVNGSKIDSDLTTGKDVGNDTTYWKTPAGKKIVFYGDTDGQIDFLTTGGSRINVALKKDSSTITRSSILGSEVNGGTNWEYQGTGAATELLLAKNHLVFGVNTSSRMGETWFYSVGVADDVYVQSVQGGTYIKGQNVVTKVVVGSKAASAGTRVPNVRLYVDGELVGTKRVDLKPGEKKEVYFMWTAEKKISNGKLKATINIPSEFGETNTSNNTKNATYNVNGGPPIELCTRGDRNESGLVKTETVTDEEGKSYTVNYYEYLSTTLSSPSPQKLHAGYGFSFNVQTLYIDETSTYSGPKKVNVNFPDSPNYVGKNVSMENTETTKDGMSEVALWELPFIYVEKYSGNVFYNQQDTKRDREDELVVKNGERKWYTDFYTKDGIYPYKTVASNAGKNKLQSCFTGYTDVTGTPFDDFVRRSVLPDTPFLDSDRVGYNWKGKDEIIGDLIDFYYNKHNNTNSSQTYYLKPEVVDNIKKEQKTVLTKSEANYFFSSYNFSE